MGKKSTLLQRTLLGVILMSKKLMSFRRTFFDIMSICEKSMLFWCTFFNLILMAKKNRRCFHVFFDATLMENWWKFEDKKSLSFWHLFLKSFLIYQKPKPFKIHFLTNFVSMYFFKNNFIPPWNVLGDYTGFKNIYTDPFLIWS